MDRQGTATSYEYFTENCATLPYEKWDKMIPVMSKDVWERGYSATGDNFINQ